MVYFCIIVGAATVCTVVGMVCDYKIKKLEYESRKMFSIEDSATRDVLTSKPRRRLTDAKGF